MHYIVLMKTCLSSTKFDYRNIATKHKDQSVNYLGSCYLQSCSCFLKKKGEKLEPYIYIYKTICKEIHSKMLFWKICHYRKTQGTANLLLINNIGLLTICLSDSKVSLVSFAERQDICIFK